MYCFLCVVFVVVNVIGFYGGLFGGVFDFFKEFVWCLCYGLFLVYFGCNLGFCCCGDKVICCFFSGLFDVLYCVGFEYFVG